MFSNSCELVKLSQTTSFDKLIKKFKSALICRKPIKIRAIWSKNSLLQKWYSSQPVEFRNNELTDLRSISFDELTETFRSVLASQVPYVIKDMWDRSHLLQLWYSGQPVNFGTKELDRRTISLEELSEIFNRALTSRTRYVIKAIWDKNPLLRTWYSGGHPVNFGTKELGDIPPISFGELIKNFKSALASQTSYVIKAMWEKNEKLHHAIHALDLNQFTVLLKKVMSSSKHGQSDFIIQYIKWVDKVVLLNEVLEDIKKSYTIKPSSYKANQISVLINRLTLQADTNHPDSIAATAESSFEANTTIIDLATSQPQSNINVTAHNELADVGAISLEEPLIKFFKSALASQSQDISIKTIWNQNSGLRLWYSGQPVNFGNGCDDTRTISLEELIEIFKPALISRISCVIKVMWDENPLLQRWYRGQPVEFSNNELTDVRSISLEELIQTFKSVLASSVSYIIKDIWDESSLLRMWCSGDPVNFGNDELEDIHTISLKGLIEIFRPALASRTPYIIKALWEKNLLLRTWYSGRPVNFCTNELDDIPAISVDELLQNFKSALSSRTLYVIKAMWDKNEKLHHAIHALDLHQFTVLLKKVMSSSKQGKNNFIVQYVDWVDKVALLNEILEDLQNSYKIKPSSYKANQISVLIDRLTQLEADTKVKKRKASSELTPQDTKKRKAEEIIQAELRDLVSKMPANLNNTNNFCVTEELGERVQKLPKKIKDEWGIESIRKIIRHSEYKVVAEKLKYNAFLKKHSPSLLEDSIPVALHNNRNISQNHASNFLYFLPPHDRAGNTVEKEPEHTEIDLGEFLDFNNEDDFFLNLAENDWRSTSNLTPPPPLNPHDKLWNNPESQQLMYSEENHVFASYDSLTPMIEENRVLLFNPTDELNQSPPNLKKINSYQPTLFGYSYNAQNPSPLPSNEKIKSQKEIIHLPKHTLNNRY